MMKLYSFVLLSILILPFTTRGQSQACPVNINFATGDLSFWSAKTGLVNGASQNYPAPNAGASIIQEYSLPVTGIRVITSSTLDLYGGFPTVPTINGYAYNYSVKIGSTVTSHDLQSSAPNPGGFTRAISYTINVPAGSSTVPYTMTYAYAMVLENGTHNSNEQPLFKATLSTHDSVISCASPKYYLPTFNNTNNQGSGASLDTATAIRNGFKNSPVAFLSYAGNGTGNYLYDVWTKDWTEVTFDLSPYRGQQVTLTFESDNCAPGAHFAYAYVALRNTCDGLTISGEPVVCAGSTQTYSVPSLANGQYQWQVPPGWTIRSGGNTNIIEVTVGTTNGSITAHEVNGCADLRDTIAVQAKPPTVAGQVNGDNEVCSGSNSSTLNLSGQVGTVVRWIYSTDGSSWTPIANTNSSYTAQNLTATTRYRAIVQNGAGCNADTASAATVTVDPRSLGGQLSPGSLSFCAGQNADAQLQLSGHRGNVVNWQVSPDGSGWNGFAPSLTTTSYNVQSITATRYYRTIVQSGVCPADTSTVATVNFINTPYPNAGIAPDSSFICYGASADLNATINIGTSYTWSPVSGLSNFGDGTVPQLPYTLHPVASPLQSANYVLTVLNAGCPNAFRDTFHVNVSPKIIVSAGRDTAIIAGQPVPLKVTTNDPTANQFLWSPSTGLNFTNISNPVAILTASQGSSILYVVKATNDRGCTGQDSILVRIFQTGAEIFVPDAFTPNGDGKNDIIRPVCVGIRQLNYFRIYNRWGQLVYSNNSMEGGGWDGRIKGTLQSSANFVYMAEGIDFNGQTIFKKGNVVLIR